MVGTAVFQFVLNELIGGKALPGERHMVGTAGSPGRKILEAQGFDALHPGLEERECRIVPFQIDSAETSGSIVHVQVEGELVETRKLLSVPVQILVHVTA